MKQEQRSDICSQHSQPFIISDEQNLLCLECIKKQIGKPNLVSLDQFKWKKQHLLIDSQKFAENVHNHYIKVNESINNELQFFLQGIEEFQKETKDALHSSLNKREKCFLQLCNSEPVQVAELEEQYYNQYSEFQNLHQKVETSIQVIQSKLNRLEQFINELYKQQQLSHIIEDNNQLAIQTKFKSPQTQFTKNYEEFKKQNFSQKNIQQNNTSLIVNKMSEINQLQIINANRNEQQFKFQMKEQECKELNQQIKELDEKYQKNLILNKKAKAQYDEAQDQIFQLQQDWQKEKLAVSKLTRQIEVLEKSINEIEQEKNSKEQFGASVNQQVQALSKELSRKKNELQNVTFERDNLIVELDNQKAQFTQQFLATDYNYKAIISELEEEIKTKEEIIKRIQIELEKQQQISKDLNLKLKGRDSTIEQLNRENSQLIYDIEAKDQDCNNLSFEKKNIEQWKEQYQKELAEITKSYESTKQQYRDSVIERGNLKGLIQQKEIEFSTLINKFIESERQKNQYLEQCRKMNEDYLLTYEQQIKEAEKWAIQGYVSEAKISRVIQNFGETTIYEKLSGPLEKIMQSEFKINQFNKDPNFQADRTNYNLYEIGLDNNKFNQYVKQGKFFLIDECFTYTDRKQITGQISIKANAESEFYKGYLIKIEETREGSLKGKTLLRKDLKIQISASATIEDAARLANNNIFCAWLQQQFNKDLAAAKLQTMEYAIQRQFVLEHKEKKEFYYCELVEEGGYKKINGGRFVPQNEDVHQYFNAFSMYSHNYFQNELMITNFQTCGNYIHDMIVNTTHKGLFSPLDQGPNECLQFTEIITKQSADILAKCWNENIKVIAQKPLCE